MKRQTARKSHFFDEATVAMNMEQTPREVHDLIPLDRSTRQHLEKCYLASAAVDDDVEQDSNEQTLLQQNFITFGGIVADGCRAWLINERSLEVVSTVNGRRYNMWEFGREGRLDCEINCAVQLRRGQADGEFDLVIAADAQQSGGLVFLFDPSRNVISKTVFIPRAVAAIEAISRFGPLDSTQLRYKHSMVAVGTCEGAVYLVDVQSDEPATRGDKCEAGQLLFVDGATAAEITRIRGECLGENRFLAHFLNVDGLVEGVFHYYATSDSSMDMTFSSGEVYVSSLHFLHQASMLAVGFSFGGFQLWNLNTLTLEFSCPCAERRSLPVIKFAFQEPDNDPRDDCYLWVVRGHAVGDDYVPEDITNACLYCLTFGCRSWTDGVGFCYQELISCLPRFEWGLTLELSFLRHGDEGILGSRLISCLTIEEKPRSSCHRVQHRLSADNRSSPSDREDGGKSLCLFVWKTFFVDPSRQPKTCLAIYDLNQWYQSQMPSTLRFTGVNMCPYLGFFSMNEMCKQADQGSLLSIDVLVHTISRPFALYPSEKLFYPSFLSFGVVALFTTGIVRASFPGLQGQVFDELMRYGTRCLNDPERALHLLCQADIVPLHGEPLRNVLSKNAQREVILSMALEQNLVEFLRLCIRDWSTGRNVTDTCNLRFFQEWAWTRVTFIKMYIDKQCPILYDCSGLRLEASVINCLHARVAQLKHLEKLLRRVVSCSTITEQGSIELVFKADVTALLAIHLDIVLWFLNFGLLPESHENPDADSINLVYPRTALSRSYDELRCEAQRIHGNTASAKFLLIDGLVSIAGDQIISLWKKEAIEAAVECTKGGQYPPPTLHALLAIFLLDSVPLSAKHRIVQYFFFDLAMLLNGGPHAHIVDNLVMYPAAYGLSPSLTKLTQGFWLLDHKNFDEAISVLLHPIIETKDITPCQHRQIMKAFLHHEEAQKALRYASVRQPPHDSLDDQKFQLTLLIAGRCLTEAFFYQREIRNQSNAEDILNHFFLGCLQSNCLREILHLPFSLLEESYFESFLLKNPEKKCRDYLVVYFMIRSKYVEAKRLNDQLAYSEKLETDPASNERAGTRRMLVDGFYHLLPKVQTDMCEKGHSMLARGKPSQYIVKSCRPLSTYVHKNSGEPSTSSTFVSQVMECVSDLWNRPSKDYTNTPFKTLPKVIYPELVSRSVDHSRNDDQSLFVGSPSKKARILDVFNPSQSSATATRQFVGNVFIAEPLSLLQTPPVRRKTPSPRRGTPSVEVTPQSILKWRSNVSSPASSLKRRHLDIDKQTTTPVLAACSTLLASADVISKGRPDTQLTETEGESDDQNSLIIEPGPLRQLRFQHTDACDANENEEEDDDDADTVTFPGSDIVSFISESVASDDSRSPVAKNPPKKIGDLQPVIERPHSELLETPITVDEKTANDSETANDSDGDEEDRDDNISDDDEDRYLTPINTLTPPTTVVPTSPSNPATTRTLSVLSREMGSSLVAGFESEIEFRKTISARSVIETSTSETKISPTQLNKPSITNLKGLTPGDLFKKFVEYRSKLIEEDLASGMDEGTEGPPSLKSLVDTTVESLLSTSSAHDEGPVFVSGVYKCDFPSRRMAAATSNDSKSVEIRDKTWAKHPSPATTETIASSPSSDVDQLSVQAAGTLWQSTKPERSLDELSMELQLDKAYIAEQQQTSSSSVTSSSSRRSTHSAMAMYHTLENTGMQLRSRRTSTASSASPESLKQPDTERRSTRPGSKAKESGNRTSEPSTPQKLATPAPKSGRRSSLRGKGSDGTIKPEKMSTRMSAERARRKTFSFSDPTILADDKDAAELVKSSPTCVTDTSPFIFSPPLTRSRSNQLKSRHLVRTPSRPLAIKKRKIPSSRLSESSIPTASDSISLLSPIHESDDGGNDKNEELRPQHNMTLRRSKTISKSRRSSSVT